MKMIYDEKKVLFQVISNWHTYTFPHFSYIFFVSYIYHVLDLMIPINVKFQAYIIAGIFITYSLSKKQPYLKHSKQFCMFLTRKI